MFVVRWVPLSVISFAVVVTSHALASLGQLLDHESTGGVSDNRYTSKGLAYSISSLRSSQYRSASKAWSAGEHNQ